MVKYQINRLADYAPDDCPIIERPAADKEDMGGKQFRTVCRPFRSVLRRIHKTVTNDLESPGSSHPDSSLILIAVFTEDRWADFNATPNNAYFRL